MLSDREIAIYSLGKTEGVNSIAETLGKGFDDEKYIESSNIFSYYYKHLVSNTFIAYLLSF